MREILFRGKPSDPNRNEAWAIGYLVKLYHYLPDEGYITAIIPCDEELFPHNEVTDIVRVYPETVGQYIGSTDIDGEYIFEGDILQIDQRYSFSAIEREEKLTVGFSSTSFHTISNRDRCGCETTIDDSEYGIYMPHYKIVGNIHDNPELLEVDTNG